VAENTVKNTATKERKKGNGIFYKIDRAIDLERLFEEGIPYKYLPKVLFTVLMILVYIANTYTVEKSIREIQTIKKELEDLRADYTTMKAEYMTMSKQSEVAKKVESIGLRESKKPPFKVVVKEGEY